jgi:hypothetical protein
VASLFASTPSGTSWSTSRGKKKTAAGTLRIPCSSRETSQNSSAPSSAPSSGTAPRDPDHTELDEGHGRVTRRSLWGTGAGDIDFPHVSQASPADLAKLARGQPGIESVYWLRDTAWAEDANTGYSGNGLHATATLRNLAISLLYLSGVTQITRTLQAIARDRNRAVDYLPL